MKILVLNGSAPDCRTAEMAEQLVAEELRRRGWEVTTLPLRDLAIAPCTGCFGCWVKTPGVCVLADDGREVARKAIQSHLLVLLTPVTFGGYSSQLKKALDRMIPLISPHFQKIGGETHHQPRYRRYPSMVVVGTLPAPDAESEATFASLVARNAINLHTEAAAGVVYEGGTADQAAETIRRLLATVGVGP